MHCTVTRVYGRTTNFGTGPATKSFEEMKTRVSIPSFLLSVPDCISLYFFMLKESDFVRFFCLLLLCLAVIFLLMVSYVPDVPSSSSTSGELSSKSGTFNILCSGPFPSCNRWYVKNPLIVPFGTWKLVLKMFCWNQSYRVFRPIGNFRG